MKDKIELVLSKIGDLEEKIYNEFGDDEIEDKFSFLDELDDIKIKYKNDDNKLYESLILYLEKINLVI
jgi:hypothetical protein